MATRLNIIIFGNPYKISVDSRLIAPCRRFSLIARLLMLLGLRHTGAEEYIEVNRILKTPKV